MNSNISEVSSYARVQSILGIDFISPEEVMEVRPGVVYSKENLTTLAETIPLVEVLKWCRDNDYVVLPAPPTAMSTLDVLALKPEHFREPEIAWFVSQKFASEDKVSPGWLLIKKEPVQDSIGKTWGEQKKSLSQLEAIPNASEIVWFITTYFEVRGIRLFGTSVRTSSTAGLSHIQVSSYCSGRLLEITYCWDNSYRNHLGLSVARKS